MLNILGIRYMLSMNSYQRYLPVVVATDVSDETVAYIRESNNELPGVDVLAESVREYKGGDGVFDKIEPPLRCWKRSGHGYINTIAEALETLVMII